MMTTKSNKRKERFQIAIRASLERLIDSGEKITKQKVIENARFDNGGSVGKTTLYSKNEKSGAYVHADLLKEIDKASESQRKKKTGVTRADTLSGLRRELRELKEERDALVDQVVEQESRLLRVEHGMEGNNNIVSTQEVEIYILSSVLSELTSGAIGEIKQLINRFERKYRNDERLKLAKDEINNYLVEINNSKVIGLENSKTVKSV